MSDVDTTRELARWLVEYEFENPEARYKSHIQLIDFYAMKLDELMAEARNAALDDLLGAMPKEHIGWKQMPTKQQVGVSDGYNKALADVTATIHQLKSSKKGADDE